MSAPITSAIRALGRVLLSGMFVVGGLDAARHPDAKVAQAKTITDPLARTLPLFPHDTATMVRLNGAFQVAAATWFALGPRPRLPALGLAASLVPTTLAGHRFWDATGDERFGELVAFLANTAVLGGLLVVTATPATKESAS